MRSFRYIFRKNLSYPVSVGKHRFRIFDDPTKLPFHRAAAFMQVQDKAPTRVGPALFANYQKSLRASIEAGEKEKAIRTIDWLDALMDMDATMNVVIEYACTFIILEGEPYDRPSVVHDKVKWDLVGSDDAVLAFFLTVAVPYLVRTKDLPKNLTTYLMDQGRLKVENRLLSLIGVKPLMTSRQS